MGWRLADLAMADTSGISPAAALVLIRMARAGYDDGKAPEGKAERTYFGGMGFLALAFSEDPEDPSALRRVYRCITELEGAGRIKRGPVPTAAGRNQVYVIV